MDRPAGSAKLLRAMNESAALGHLLDGGALTRNDLRELTGLSKPTTSEVLRRLTEVGLAVVTGHTSGGPGPNAEIYTANPDAAYAVAVSVRETAGRRRAPLGRRRYRGQLRAALVRRRPGPRHRPRRHAAARRDRRGRGDRVRAARADHAPRLAGRPERHGGWGGRPGARPGARDRGR